jgi:hypothetical protein
MPNTLRELSAIRTVWPLNIPWVHKIRAVITCDVGDADL